MATDPRTPCLIGAARRTWRGGEAPEPLEMWATVAADAAADARAPSALGSVGEIDVVFCQSWRYDDPTRWLAELLGAAPSAARESPMGGAIPLDLVGEAASSMLSGALDLALVVGGEALATRRRLTQPRWSHPDLSPRPWPIVMDPLELRHGIYQAYTTFALLDSARRIRRGVALEDHRHDLGNLLAPLSAVAAAQPEHAWFPLRRAPDELTIASPSNRMVSTPYTKLMTAVMDVDMAAAVLLATEARADALGVPRERRVYLRGWGRASEPRALAARPEPWRSPAMEHAMGAALGSVAPDAVAHLDLYSCFASSLAFATDALAIAPGDPRPLTVTGGLPYHGGPGSNYATHALAAMASVLREDPGSLGLVTGVGMHMEHHSATLWSTTPMPVARPEPPGALASLAVEERPAGNGVVAAFSTVLGRDRPPWTALLCELPGGTRCYARLLDPPPLEVDLAGASVWLVTDDDGVTTASLTDEPGLLQGHRAQRRPAPEGQQAYHH